MLFKPKYWLVFQLPRALDLSFPVALIRDLIMTDCSCEGFTEIVKSWLAGGSFFPPLLLLLLPFLSLLFCPSSAERERKRGRDRKGRSVEWQGFRSLSHLVSFL